MPTLSINLPDEYFEQLSDIAKELGETPESCMLIALDNLVQTDAIDAAIEAVTRLNDGQALVDFPELKEEMGVELQFHPTAMSSLEALDEELQIEVLGQLVGRLAAEEEELMDTIDLTIKETPEGELVVSSFDFGDIAYLAGDEGITIYHLDVAEDYELDDDFDDDEDDDLEDYEEDEDDYEEEDLEEELDDEEE